ncbi:MAG TPA: non-homologous end-joining DNA ligase [Gemmataceae bacterium]|nr:non-homologous end-joining DNA ligase [Gemmataceae bacterium]
MNELLYPMLATSAAPFDAEDYLFEVKWDGVRALAAVAEDRWRLWGRTGSDYTERYPELSALRRLPAGTVVDGELVVLQGGRADFPALLQRHQRQVASPLDTIRRRLPIRYLVFDLLFHEGRSLLKEPLRERRARLHELLTELKEPLLTFSDGIVGQGRDFFARVVAQGHEGVMAKHLTSPYQPGKRSSAWKKIKPVQVLPCVIVGYRPGRKRVRSLLVATVRAGTLSYVGQVNRGLSAQTQTELAQRLAQRHRPRPLVSCPKTACWVEPDVYCRVRFQEWTPHGRLRHAVFDGWLEGSK